MNDIFVRTMVSDDLTDTLALLNSALGDDYIQSDELYKYASIGPKVARVAVTTEDDVLAACTGEILSPEEGLNGVAHQSNIDELRVLVPEAFTSRTGVLKSAAVGVRARGSGLGTAVSGATLTALLRKGAECVVGFAWTDKEGCRSEGLLNRLGFEKRGEIAGFWNQDSIEKGYSCPSCEKDCQCTASIFVKVVTG